MAWDCCHHGTVAIEAGCPKAVVHRQGFWTRAIPSSCSLSFKCQQYLLMGPGVRLVSERLGLERVRVTERERKGRMGEGQR